MYKNEFIIPYTQTKINVLFYFLYKFWYDSCLFIHNYNLNIVIWL